MTTFGEVFKNKRKELGMTLRQFCLMNNLDPGNISKLERGRLTPPQHDKLEEYASMLGIKKGTDDYYEFFDLAAKESGRVPKDILSDKEVAEKLPLFFRTLRGKKVSDKTLNELIEKMKKA